VQKAFTAAAGVLILAVWMFLVLTTPLVAVILTLAAIAWRDSRRRRSDAGAPVAAVRVLRSVPPR
jgi:hypothetical protein